MRAYAVMQEDKQRKGNTIDYKDVGMCTLITVRGGTVQFGVSNFAFAGKRKKQAVGKPGCGVMQAAQIKTACALALAGAVSSTPTLCSRSVQSPWRVVLCFAPLSTPERVAGL